MLKHAFLIILVSYLLLKGNRTIVHIREESKHKTARNDFKLTDLIILFCLCIALLSVNDVLPFMVGCQLERPSTHVQQYAMEFTCGPMQAEFEAARHSDVLQAARILREYVSYVRQKYW